VIEALAHHAQRATNGNGETGSDRRRPRANDHRRLFNQRVVTDLSEVSPEFLERAKSAGRALLEARGVLGKTVE